MSEKSNIPHHIAIIMDGNGRWAQNRGQDRAMGHIEGAERVLDITRASLMQGVRYLTLYAFSTENWRRPEEEVSMLMELICNMIEKHTSQLVEEGVKMEVIGEESGLSYKVREILKQIKEKTAGCDKLTLTLAINYSSRWEVTKMVRQISGAVAKGELCLDAIDYKTIENNLSTVGYPDPDLLIRTSGECRLSNFMLLQLAYSELYFTKTLWPDFKEKDLNRAIEEYQARSRRYGAL